jgi:20S proteasome alpha/beta subunit
VLRLLVVDLAVRAYRNDHELPPAELSQLVPEYLQRIPDDPYGSGPLIYKPQGTDFVLYSVGPNGIDDGGDFVVIEEPFSVPHTGDFCFDQEYAQSDPEHAP